MPFWDSLIFCDWAILKHCRIHVWIIISGASCQKNHIFEICAKCWYITIHIVLGCAIHRLINLSDLPSFPKNSSDFKLNDVACLHTTLSALPNVDLDRDCQRVCAIGGFTKYSN